MGVSIKNTRLTNTKRLRSLEDPSIQSDGYTEWNMGGDHVGFMRETSF